MERTLWKDDEDVSHLTKEEQEVVIEVSMTEKIVGEVHMALLEFGEADEIDKISTAEIFKIAVAIRTNIILERGLNTANLTDSPAFLEAIAMQLGQKPG